MRFKYIFINKEGERQKGSAVAADKYELAHRLKSEGGTLVFAEEDRGNMFSRLKQFSFFSRVSADERINFAHNLSAMIRAGLSLSRALSIISRQSKNERFKQVIEEVAAHIKEGGDLAGGLAKFPDVFSPLFVSMVHAGEESGGLANALEMVGLQLKKNHELVKKVKGAMIYPSIVLTVMIVVGVVMIIKVVPTLTSTFSEMNVELPTATKVLIFMSNMMQQHLALIIAGTLGLIGFFVVFFRSRQGMVVRDTVLLRTPLISTLVREMNAARTARTLSSLLSSGVDIVEALAITRDVLQNIHFKNVVRDAGEQIQKGVLLSHIFSTDEALRIYPLLFSEMVAVGEETGKLSDMLEEVAGFFEGEVEAATKNMSTIVEPLLMVVVGAAVGFFAMAMISPMYSVMSGI
ncbi:MAG: type II secretion system F family protein [Candidatus Yonathbacteria bacterium]|nr:type II secretion system F family protein [Candidatus Yonathbacteria bacterium]